MPQKHETCHKLVLKNTTKYRFIIQKVPPSVTIVWLLYSSIDEEGLFARLETDKQSVVQITFNQTIGHVG